MKLILGALVLWAGAATADPFQDVTQLWGIDQVHSAGLAGEFHLPEIMGSGLAVFDADGDHWLDLAFVGGASKSVTVYLQTAPRKFQLSQTLPLTAFGMGIAVGDVDNDGDDDLVVTTTGRDGLFRNEGGEFVDMSSRLGPGSTQWTTSAAFCDLDRDGWLDLYVGGYVQPSDQVCRTGYGARDYCPPNVYAPVDDLIYLNQAGVRFERASVSAGALSARGARLPALGVVCEDFNADGITDVFVANDGTRNLLWLNDGMQRTDVGLPWGVATNLFGQAEAGMGIAVGDVTGDGRKDIFVTHVDRESNTLYVRQGEALFVDASIMRGLSASSLAYTGFGVAMLDIENDGDLDIAIANGAVRRSGGLDAGEFAAIYGQRDQLYENGDGGVFRLAGTNGDFGRSPRVSRGLIAADLDRDGAVDLVVTTAHGPARVLRNVAASKGRWLAVKLVDSAAVLGAEVTVREITRSVAGATSYLSAYSGPVHFGLGEIESVPDVFVTWPDGQGEVFKLEDLDRQVTLHKGTGFGR